MSNALISIPKRARRGEIIEVKTLISHVMETGYRRTESGMSIPRDILRLFVCSYVGEEIFRAEIHPAFSANPYLAFHLVATETGTLICEWSGDNGFRAAASANLIVE